MNPAFVYLVRPLAKISSITLFTLLTATTVFADDLLQIFDLAVTNDPETRQARALYSANHTVLEQGMSFLLPTIGLSANTSRDTQGPSAVHSFGNGFSSEGYGLNLRQALVNFQAWYAFQSARKADAAAATRLVQAEQALILKVATAYFDVLRSQAALATFQAEETASNQVLEQT